MSFIYPTNPVVGQDYTINGKSLRYNGIGFIPSPQTSDQAPDVFTEILPTDYIGGRRSVTGAEWTYETLRNNIIASGGVSTVFVSTADEFVAAIRMERSNIEICVTKPITVNPFSNVYADKVYLTGCEIALPDNIILLTKTSAGTTTDYLINNSLKYHVTDPASSVIVVTAADKTWNITARNFDNNELVAMTVLGAGSAVNLITGNTVYLNVPDSSGTYTATVDATLDLGQEDIRLDGSNVLDVSPAILPGDKMLIKKGNYNFELVDVASLAGSLSGTAGTWEFSYDNGDVIVFGDASKSGRFGIKVAFKFKARATAYECNLFPNTDIGTWVRFEHADWCINADNTGGLANLNQSLTVKGFFDGVTDFTQSGNYSNIAGAGSVSENQQDDGTRYLQATQRIHRNDCTFTIGTNAVVSTADVWLLIHLSGTIL